MVRRLYERFLEDPHEYRAAELFWTNLANTVASELGINAWEPWMPRTYAGGAPFELDGNPIFDARSVERDRAVRVIQHYTTTDDVEIVAWLKHYPEEFLDLPSDELVINIGLSEESAERARNLLRIWMDPHKTKQAMQDAIDRLGEKL